MGQRNITITLTWPKVIGAMLASMGFISGAVWAGAKVALQDRAAIVSRISAMETNKASDARVDYIDEYVHKKCAEQDVFAAKISEQLNAIISVQQIMQRVDEDTNAKIDKIIDKLIEKRVAFDFGGE